MNQNNFKPMIIEPMDLGMDAYLNKLMYAPFIPLTTKIKGENKEFPKLAKGSKYKVIDLKPQLIIPEPKLPEVIVHPRNVGRTQLIFNKLNAYQQALITGFIDKELMRAYHSNLMDEYILTEKKLLVDKYGYSLKITINFKTIDKIINKLIDTYKQNLKLRLALSGHYEQSMYEFKSYISHTNLKPIGSKYF